MRSRGRRDLGFRLPAAAADKAAAAADKAAAAANEPAAAADKAAAAAHDFYHADRDHGPNVSLRPLRPQAT